MVTLLPSLLKQMLKECSSTMNPFLHFHKETI